MLSLKQVLRVGKFAFTGLCLALLITFSLAFASCPGPSDPPPAGPSQPVATHYEIGGLLQIYSGDSKAVTVTPKAGASSGAVTVSYAGTEGTVYEKSETAPSAAGSYTVYLNVVEALPYFAAAEFIAGTLRIREPLVTMTTGNGGINIRLGGSGEATVDWGDGSVPLIQTLVNNDTALYSHTYAAAGEKTIRIVSEGTLTYLICTFNQLTSLDVSKNTALTSLSCDNNQLTSLDVSKNTALTQLTCTGNQFTSLDVTQNTALTFLSCGRNQFTSLDLSNNTALTNLLCGSNQLTSLDISKNTALRELFCYESQLTSLDVSNNIALTRLDCYNNQLTSLDVSNNPALEVLSCTGNQLTSLDVSNNPELTDLLCGDNQLTELDVNNNTVLRYLFCAGNLLTTLDISKNTALTDLNCSSNQMDKTALEAVFTDLADRTGMSPTGTIRCGGNPGFAAADKSIAANKGWTVY